jgi:SAM-dependent methyltransferase
MGPPSSPVLAYDVEPSNRRFRLRLARYPAAAATLGERLPSGPSLVLDAGCGRGRLPSYWPRWGRPGEKAPRFMGADISTARAAERARDRYALILRADLAGPWPFRDGAFDAVVCEQVLEHLADEEVRRALSEIRRVLRPGGVALIGTPVFKPIEALLAPLFRPIGRLLRRARGEGPGGHRQLFTAARLRALVAEQGLAPEEVRGYRLFSIGRNWFEDSAWYYRLHRRLGARWPGLCVEATVVARRP